VSGLADAFGLLPLLIHGAQLTIEVTVLSGLLGLVIGLLVALARLSAWRALRLPVSVYVEVFRGTSGLVQLFYLFYVLPLVGLRFDPFPTAVMGLGLNMGAYASEVIRGAIVSVEKDQREAAIALDMGPLLTMRRIILPQAVLPMIPPLGNLLVDLLKSSSLVSLITINELSAVGRHLVSQTGRASEVLTLVLLLYLAMGIPLVQGIKVVERRLGLTRGQNVP
jgi:polar amino acid transport system permease protein